MRFRNLPTLVLLATPCVFGCSDGQGSPSQSADHDPSEPSTTVDNATARSHRPTDPSSPAAPPSKAPPKEPSSPAPSESGSGAPENAAPNLPGAPATATKFQGGRIAIPPRMQWENDNGYCGETSVQSIALYNGAWVSQQTVRTLAGGELLLGVNADKALKKLHFQFESWRGSGSSQFQSYMAWMKKNLSAGVPVIFAAYLSGSSDSDYDHIMPAIGVQSTNATGGFGSSDKLEWNTLFSSQTVTNTFGALGGSRSSCKLSIGKGGCVPLGVDYGIAVPGFLDKDQATLPIKLTVDKASEPNLSQGAAPGTLQGTLTVYGLQPGRNYALLRYNGFESVPESGTPADYLKSAFGNRVTFTAKTGSWSYTDPNTIKTDSTTYYKVVPVTP